MENNELITKFYTAFSEGNSEDTHTDTFDLYKWTKQAMGPVGYILGWTPFMKNKIQKITNGRLDEFINN